MLIRTSLLMLCFGCAAAAAVSTTGLMPMPARISAGAGRLAIDGSFGIALNGCRDPRVQAAAERLLDHVSKRTGIPLLPAAAGQAPASGMLVIGCAAMQPSPAFDSLGEDESYTLVISPANARLRASTALGALHGMETFLQLITLDGESFFVPAVTIDDEPRFHWRGLMIDAGRHWMPPELIRRNLDAMAAVKLNVFHWHLSEDQGFRAESKLFPKLTQMGSDGHYYTQAEMRELVAYARERGIRVVPEFDMPGHSTAWFVGYPELASGPGPYQIERSWGIFDPAINPTREETYRFLDAFIGEMTGIFPDEYFHIGGDEVNGAQWDRNPAIQAFKRAHNLKDNHDLQAYFNQRLQVILKKHGRKMMGWDEILHPGLPNDILVQSWRGQKSLADGAKLGYRGILSSGYYLDHLQPAAQHYAVDPLSGDASQLNEAEKARILGGEACMWSEYANSETIESRIWPRAAAVAERLWSAAELRDADSMYQRLAAVNRQLEWTGVRHRANYPPMLVRLADGYPARSLQVLSDAVEGLGIEPREKSHKYTSLTPLNRLVDAARPESEPVRALSNAIDRLLSQPGAPDADREEVRSALIAWRDNHARLLPLLDHSFLLKEAVPISEDLAKLGAIGLEALDHLQSKAAMPTDWGAQQKEILDRMEKPQAEVRLAAVRPVRKLVEAAAALR